MAEVLEQVVTPRGELVLRRAGADFEVISNGVFLMDTRDGRSERLLARAALDAHPGPARVLVGGLGVGFTLAELLLDDRIEAVTVVEIEPALLQWHRGHLAPFSAGGLDDPRVRVEVGDVLAFLRADDTTYDVICLDVDNGPDWTVTDANRALYDDNGTTLLTSRLRTPGVLTVWSARAVPAYEARLRRHRAAVDVLTVTVDRGDPDVVYVVQPGLSDLPPGSGHARRST